MVRPERSILLEGFCLHKEVFLSFNTTVCALFDSWCTPDHPLELVSLSVSVDSVLDQDGALLKQVTGFVSSSLERIFRVIDQCTHGWTLEKVKLLTFCFNPESRPSSVLFLGLLSRWLGEDSGAAELLVLGTTGLQDSRNCSR
jgi:hypothetical protein